MFYRDTYAEIDCDAIAHNLHLLQSKTTQSLIAVLKANAYGHSDYWTAKTAMKCGCVMVAVSSLDEALALRKQGFEEQILILGHIRPENIETAIEHHLTLSVISLEWMNQVTRLTPDLQHLAFHIKIDSGMNRIGLKSFQETQEVMKLIQTHNGQIEGIFTHYACADSENKEMCQRQYRFFADIVRQCSFDFKWIHCENSAALLDFQDKLSNACRCGLIMYGISPVPTELHLKAALSLYSHIVCIKKIRKGEVVGYGADYTADKDCIIGTLPIGYADGFIRANQGRKLYCEGEFIEVVGKICMDQCMVKLPRFYKIGTRVEIISDHLPLTQMARELHMIPYEVLCLLSDRIPRIIYADHQKIAIINNRLHEL